MKSNSVGIICGFTVSSTFKTSPNLGYQTNFQNSEFDSIVRIRCCVASEDRNTGFSYYDDQFMNSFTRSLAQLTLVKIIGEYPKCGLPALVTTFSAA